MIDENGKLYLIEINTNPDLTLCSPLVSRLIPQVLENSFRIAIDPLFPPPINHTSKKPIYNVNFIESNKYSLIYDQSVDYSQTKQYLTRFDHKKVGEIIDSDNEYD